MEQKKVRPRTVDIAKKRQSARQEMLDNALDVGDTVEYAATIELKDPRKGSVWLKFGSSTTVRPGESGNDARLRLVEFVLSVLDEQAKEKMS